METEHTETTETVVEKVTAYVKDMLGIPPAHQAPGGPAKPEYSVIASVLHFDDAELEEPSGAPELTSEDAMRLDPFVGATKSVAALDAESVERMRRQEREPIPG